MLARRLRQMRRKNVNQRHSRLWCLIYEEPEISGCTQSNVKVSAADAARDMRSWRDSSEKKLREVHASRENIRKAFSHAREDSIECNVSKWKLLWELFEALHSFVQIFTKQTWTRQVISSWEALTHQKLIIVTSHSVESRSRNKQGSARLQSDFQWNEKARKSSCSRSAEKRRQIPWTDRNVFHEVKSFFMN